MSKKGFSVAATLQSIFFHSVIVLSVSGWLVVAQAVAQNPTRVVTRTGDELRKNIKEWHEPDYPAIARAARAGGPVEVELMVDEQGNVTSARVVSGHPLLQAEMLKAARAWKFKPLIADGVAVRVAGRVTYTFPLSNSTFNRKTIMELEKDVRKRPRSSQAHFELAEAYVKLLRYVEAIDQFKLSIKLDPTNAEARVRLGHAYMRIHSYGKARDEFIEAARLDSNYSEPLHALGLAYVQLGNYEEAIIAFEKSLKVEGPIVASYFMIGKCQVLLDRPEKAVGFYKQGLERHPDSDMGHYGLGEAYFLLGQYSDAISEIKLSIKLSEGPGRSAAHYHLGLAYLRMGDSESASKEYEILKKLNEELAAQLMKEIRKSIKQRGIS